MLQHAVATPDGHLAVVADGKLSLYSIERGARVASVEVVGDHLVVCGSYLLVHAHDNLASLLTLFSIPDLTAVSCVELAAPTRLLAATSSVALIDRGDQAFMVQTSGGNLAVVPLRPPATFDSAFGLDGDLFLTLGRRGTETWDANERRPVARLGLDVPEDTRACGVTLRGTALWMAAARPFITVVRLSDGRPTMMRLDAPARAVRSHRALAWLVADIGETAMAINLALRTMEPLDRSHGEVVALAPVAGRDTAAHAIALDGARLVLQLLGGDATKGWTSPATPIVEVEAPAPPPPVFDAPAASLPAPLTAREPSKVQTVSDRLAARMGRAPSAAPAATSPAPAPVVDVPAVIETPAPSVVAPAPAPVIAAPAPAPVIAAPVIAAPVFERPRALPPRPAPPPRPAAAAVPRSPRANLGNDDWRDRLVTWARTPGAPLPALDETPLGELAARGVAGTAGWPMLCALYAGWLDGDHGTGLAITALVERGGDAGDRWPEALGTGALDQLGLATWERGRARLAIAVGEFLDGRPPRAIEPLIVGVPRPPPPGVLRVDVALDDTPHHAAYALAARVGVLAWCEPTAGSFRTPALALERGRLEAWLRGWPLATALDPGAITPRVDETVVWLAVRGAADHPGAPPRWSP